MPIFLDTNVLAYQFDDSAAIKQKRARQILVEHASDAVISTQVLIELHAVLTRKLGRTRADALAVIDALDLDIIATDGRLVRQAASTADIHDLSIFDALVLEAAVRGRCTELWTEDLTHNSTLRGVTVINPFRP